MGTSEKVLRGQLVMFVQVFGPVVIQKDIYGLFFFFFFMGVGKISRKNIQEKLEIVHTGRLLTLSKHQL